MLTLQEISRIIQESIEQIRFESRPAELYAPLDYTLKLGGKRIRPQFCLLAYNLFKEDIDTHITYPAIALEVFHNFTLIHDDIMDRADLRRGQPTVYKKWNNNIAILSGDAMCISSYKLLSHVPAPQMSQALKLFSHTALGVCEGQQYDMNFETASDVSMEEYTKMVELKTALLIACSAKLGALIAQAPDKICNQIYDFAFRLGTAFQIQDDYFDSFGEEKVFGKKIGGDILNNKKTWLLIKCQNMVGEERGAELESLLALAPSQEKIEKVREFFIATGVKTLAEQAVGEYYREALQILKEADLDALQKRQLRDFADILVQRVK